MYVKYLGATESQMNLGNYSGNYDELKIGKEYVLENKIVHSWHTEFFLKDVDGSFNSICFEKVKNRNK